MKNFRSKTSLRVRNVEIDSQGIVHNAIYLQYFETGRFEYLRSIGYEKDFASVVKGTKVVLVRNEINYRSSARFDDLLDLYTRVSVIGRTSFIFEGIIQNSKTKKIIADNLAVHVWLHPRTGEPVPVPKKFIGKIQRYERRKNLQKTARLGGKGDTGG
jgi:acyl-CoA thioester hydrolase